MPLSEQDAVRRAKELLDASYSARAAYEAACGLWLAYTYGNQWADVRNGKRGGQSLQQLRTIISANRSDVRFSMNLIRPRITKVNSRLMPKELRYRVKPASRAINDQIASLVADERMKLHLRDIGALRCLRLASLWRCVLGSVIVRRTLSSIGEPVIVRSPDGQPIMGPNGQPKTIRTFEHDWAVCAPYEFVRDPAAQSVTFDDEDAIGHEKPRTTEWLARNFGVKVETKATMGGLLEFQRFLYQATGESLDNSWQESKSPAVMVSEWWMRDSSKDSRHGWPYYMLAYRDTFGESIEDRQLKVLWFGPNPFTTLPLHHFWYDLQLLSPWGRGIPALTIQAQDATNLAFVSMVRALVTHSSNKYLIEQNSLADNMADALTNRTDIPIVYKRGSTKPDRMPPGQIDSAGVQIIQQTPQWLDWLLNMSPVQAGQAVARGEAAKAYELRQEQADTPLTAISDYDELTMNDLLTGTLKDIIKTDTVQSLKEMLSHEFTLEQILTLKQQDSQKILSGVEIVPDTLRPRTPDEMREDFAAAVNNQMIDPIVARRTLLVKGRIVLDIKESEAYRQQLQEIQTLLSGGQVDAYLAQDHDMHQWVISLEQESPRWAGYSEQQRDALMEHWQAHDQLKAMQMRSEMEMQQPMAGGAEQPQQQLAQEALQPPPGQGAAGQQVIPFPMEQAMQQMMQQQGQQPGMDQLLGQEGAPSAGLAAAFM